VSGVKEQSKLSMKRPLSQSGAMVPKWPTKVSASRRGVSVPSSFSQGGGEVESGAITKLSDGARGGEVQAVSVWGTVLHRKA
jgi:hypothetical protein